MSPTSAKAAALLPTWLPMSSSQARAASRSASTSEPRRFSTTARWTRQIPGKMANGCCCAQRSVASVHSAARSRSPSCSQALMRLQYTLPVEYGPEPALHGEEHRLVEMAHARRRPRPGRSAPGRPSAGPRPRGSADREATGQGQRPRGARASAWSRSPPPWAVSASRRTQGAVARRTSASSSRARRARRSHPPAMAGCPRIAWCSQSPTAQRPAAGARPELVEEAVGLLPRLDARPRGGPATRPPRPRRSARSASSGASAEASRWRWPRRAGLPVVAAPERSRTALSGVSVHGAGT